MKMIQHFAFTLTAAVTTISANGAITYALSSTDTLGKGATFSETGLSLITGDVILVMAAKSSSDTGPLSITNTGGSFTGGAIQFDDTSNTFIHEYTVTGDGLFDLSYMSGVDATDGFFSTVGFFVLRADSGVINRLDVDGNFESPGVTPNTIALNWGTTENVTFLGTYTSGSDTTLPAVFNGGSEINGGNNRVVGWGTATGVTDISASWTIIDTSRNSRTTLVGYTEVVPEPSTTLLGAVGTLLLLRRRR